MDNIKMDLEGIQVCHRNSTASGMYTVVSPYIWNVKCLRYTTTVRHVSLQVFMVMSISNVAFQAWKHALLCNNTLLWLKSSILCTKAACSCKVFYLPTNVNIVTFQDIKI